MTDIPTINDYNYKIASFLTKGASLGAIAGVLLSGWQAYTTHQKKAVINDWKKLLSQRVQFMNERADLCKLFYTVQQEYESVDPTAYRHALIKCDHLLHVQTVTIQQIHEYHRMYNDNDMDSRLDSKYYQITRGQDLIFVLWQEMFHNLKNLRASIFHQEKEQYMFYHHAKLRYHTDLEKFNTDHQAWLDRKMTWELARKDQLSAVARARRKNMGLGNDQSHIFPEPEPIAPTPLPEHISQSLRTDAYEKLMGMIASMTMEIVRQVKGEQPKK